MFYTAKSAAKLRNCLGPVVKALLNNPPEKATLERVSFRPHRPHNPRFVFFAPLLNDNFCLCSDYFNSEFLSDFPNEAARLISEHCDAEISDRLS